MLLDESVPRPLAHALTGHQCATVQDCGWSGMSNGDLLRAATTRFDLFITCDQNIRYQQNLSQHAIAVLQLSTNDLRRIQASIALIESAVAGMQKCELKVLQVP